MFLLGTFGGSYLFRGMEGTFENWVGLASHKIPGLLRYSPLLTVVTTHFTFPGV